jgi:hypothetical protein
VQFSIDGFGHPVMADRWLQAPPEEQAAPSFAAAALRFLHFAVLSDVFVFAATTLGAALWSFAPGVLMWRQVRGSSTAVPAGSIG